MRASSGDAGIMASYSCKPSTLPTIGVPSDSSRANRVKLVVLQGRITGRQRSPPV
jgi:hypothetical protein